MKQPRLIVYSTLIIILVALLIGRLVLKQKINTDAKPINLQAMTEKVLGLSELNLENQTVKTSEQLSQSLPRTPYSRELLGRVDPFVMLPAEGSLSQDTSSGDVVELEPVCLVRGIMLGKIPTALVEENGVYRRVTVGDLFADGRILRITENGLVLNRNGIQVIIKMGE